MNEFYLPVHPPEANEPPPATEPIRVTVGGEEFVVCPTCQGTGQVAKVLKAGIGGRKRSKLKKYPCKTCFGKRRMPAAFYDNYIAAQKREAAQ